jgi:hypothetical protein
MTQSTPPQRSSSQIGKKTTQIQLTTQWTDPPTSCVRNFNGLTDTQTVLIPADTPSSDLICHLLTGSTEEPLCNTGGTYRCVTVADARAQGARLCWNCQIQRDGTQRTRPCPTCGTAIAVSAWPQHVRGCDDG